MTLWLDIAEWRGPVKHHSGVISDYRYVVIHTADGSYEGTIAWQKSDQSDNSSHFVVDFDGKIAQVNDTANRSGAQLAGNPYSIAIENAGNENTPLTDAQLRANAAILRKAREVHGIPLQLTGVVGRPGLGHHSMGFESGENWGHEFCPGSIIKAQKQQILDYAKGNIMALTQDDIINVASAVVQWATEGGALPQNFRGAHTNLLSLEAQLKDVLTIVSGIQEAITGFKADVDAKFGLIGVTPPPAPADVETVKTAIRELIHGGIDA